MGHGRKPRSPDTCQIKPTDRHQALAADFFDSIDPYQKLSKVDEGLRSPPPGRFMRLSHIVKI